VSPSAFKAIIAAGVLGGAMVAVWAVARIRDSRRDTPVELGSQQVQRPANELPAASPAPKAARARRPVGAKPVGAPQSVRQSQSIFATVGEPAQPASVRPPPMRAEEVAVRKVLEPIIARHPSASLPFVRCLDPGGWKQGSSPDESGESSDPLDVPSREPDQPVCRARIKARERGVLSELLREASAAYHGHMATTDPREHLDAYLGHWFESDVQVDTEESYPVVDP
jgi:hypothetical protein